MEKGGPMLQIMIRISILSRSNFETDHHLSDVCKIDVHHTESSHDSAGGGILGHLLHEISGEIVVGNSNGRSNKLDFDM